MWKSYGSIVRRYPKVPLSEERRLIAEAILVVYTKIGSYNLDYRDKQGNPNPVKFVSCIWKRIDGFIIDYLKKEMNF